MDKTTTIVMPVSRPNYLDAIFARLELLKCDRTKTNLLCIVDGDAELFVKVRNKVEFSKFQERLTVQFKSKHKFRNFDFMGRRMRIADIHNHIKENLGACTFVMGLEDDTIFPLNALEKLQKDFVRYPHAGMIQGVQLGRWGIPHVGAWKVDDVYNPTRIDSVMPPANFQLKPTVDEIDAGGFYCFMTTRLDYMSHTFAPFDHNSMGPDFNFGIDMRKNGLMNYVDWSIQTVHKTKAGDLSLLKTEPRQVTFIRKENRWRQSRI